MKSDEELCAVIIPFYQEKLSEKQLNVIKHNLNILKKWPIHFVVPNSNKLYAENLLSNNFNNKVKSFDDYYFRSIAGYNKLLTNLEFYKQFESYEFILICQLDVIVFKDEIKKWCSQNYSYVGAPWIKGNDQAEGIEKPKFFGVGNGGFSLRKNKDCMRILKFKKNRSFLVGYLLSLAKTNNYFDLMKQTIQFSLLQHKKGERFWKNLQEDFFWGLGANYTDKLFKVPPNYQALKFSFEAMPSYLYKLNNNVLPFGCHAFEKYESDFWKIIFEKNNINL